MAAPDHELLRCSQDPNLLIPHKADPLNWCQDLAIARTLMQYPPRLYIGLTFEASPHSRISACAPAGRVAMGLEEDITINIDWSVANAETSRGFRIFALSHEIGEIDFSNSPRSLLNPVIPGPWMRWFLNWKEKKVNYQVYSRLYIATSQRASEICRQFTREWRGLISANPTQEEIDDYMKNYFPFAFITPETKSH